MSKKKRGPFRFEGDVAAHPAAVALGRTGVPFGPIGGVEVLKERGSVRGVYRIFGPSAEGASVVAKKGSANVLWKERHIYETVLPALEPDRSLRFLGSVPDGPDSVWLFMEWAEGTPFEEQHPEHRRLAAEWLARLHTHDWTVEDLAGMPHRDMASYRETLDRAVSTLTRVRATNDALPPEGAATLESLASRLSELRKHWSAFAGSGLPGVQTMVHADIQPKNMVVSPDGNLLVFDWEHSGLGDPCRDLDPCIDRERYREVAAPSWPWLTRERLGRMATRGEVLRLLDAIAWGCVRLDSPWWERSLRHMESYARDFDRLDLAAFLGHLEAAT